eukprot:4590167-Amphidinium_carterae.1
MHSPQTPWGRNGKKHHLEKHSPVFAVSLVVSNWSYGSTHSGCAQKISQGVQTPSEKMCCYVKQTDYSRPECGQVFRLQR